MKGKMVISEYLEDPYSNISYDEEEEMYRVYVTFKDGDRKRRGFILKTKDLEVIPLVDEFYNMTIELSEIDPPKINKRKKNGEST